ncbi:D-tyrosyl-tRNA(Tyr) deacylase [Ostertagia ostertagi]
MFSCSDNELVEVSSIGRGVCVFVGISREDNDEDIEYIVRKILNVRLFASENKRWDKSVKDEGLEVLCVSQFTLYGYLKDASEFYARFMEKMRKSYSPENVQDGRFAAMMNVEIVNDGPVTISLDSKNKD